MFIRFSGLQRYKCHTLLFSWMVHATCTRFGRLGGSGGIVAPVLVSVNWAFMGVMQKQMIVHPSLGMCGLCPFKHKKNLVLYWQQISMKMFLVPSRGGSCSKIDLCSRSKVWHQVQPLGRNKQDEQSPFPGTDGQIFSVSMTKTHQKMETISLFNKNAFQ